jgi:hypothetical protein
MTIKLNDDEVTEGHVQKRHDLSPAQLARRLLQPPLRDMKWRRWCDEQNFKPLMFIIGITTNAGEAAYGRLDLFLPPVQLPGAMKRGP